MSQGVPSEGDPLNAVVESFLERYRRGERPALSEYTRRHPELADRLREVFPALVVIEELGSVGGGSRPPLADPSLAPGRLGDYRLLREIGRGGMGVVYEAVQESLGRHVALKVLPPSAADRPLYLERFRREARAAARLHHTNIVPVYGVGEENGTCYYAMQFIHGQGLDAVLKDVKRLRGTAAEAPAPPTVPADQRPASVAQSLLTGQFAVGRPVADTQPDAPGLVTAAPGSPSSLSGEPEVRYYRSIARLGLQAAEGLAHAHAQGVLHRDIKPSNLLLDAQGTLWITDFGLAKADDSGNLTHSGDIVGTLRYMAPERFQGKADARSDIYALGVTLYEMLTLRPPFSGKDQAELVGQVTGEAPPAPRQLAPVLPPDLGTIVVKAMAREPEARYASAGELAEDLRCFLESRPIKARRTSPVERFRRWCRRNPAVAALLAALLLVWAVGSAGVVWKWREADEARRNEHEARGEADNRAEETRRSLEGLQTAIAELELADLHASRGKLAEADASYTRAVRARPDIDTYRNERGVFYTRVGLWDLAAADFAEGFRLREPPADFGWLWYRHALLRAYVGDAAGHRDVCTRMLARLGDSPNPMTCSQAAGACLLLPGAAADPSRLVALAERADDRPPYLAWKLWLRGTAHYRAGHDREAVRLLLASLAADPAWVGRDFNYPVLAMAHQRLGEGRQARQALGDAGRAHDGWVQRLTTQGVGSIQWNVWVEYQIYYRQARLQIDGVFKEDARLQTLRARSLVALGRAP